MTGFIHLLSAVFLVAFLPSVFAGGPACARKLFQQPNCISKCKPDWGWSTHVMGTDRWGGVMREMKSNETLDDVLFKACGFESQTTTAVSPTQQPIGNAETASVTFPPTSTSFNLTVKSTAIASSVSSPSSSSASPTKTSTVALILSTSHKPSSSVAIAPSSVAIAPNTTSAPPRNTHTASTVNSVTTHATSTTEAPVSSPTVATESNTSSDDSTSSSDINTYLSSHNTVRAQHGASRLTWNNQLASKAQSWANNCVFQHSGGSLGDFGENLAAGTGSYYDIQIAVKSWTDEVCEYLRAGLYPAFIQRPLAKYDPSNPVPSHFTQVVWKGTSEVGCAVQLCDGIFDAAYGKAKFYVCEYSQQGNIIGEFAYVFFVLVTVVAVGLSCSALLAQAVRTSPKESWKNNANALVIGASYVIILLASLLYCGKRRIEMRLKLHRISKSSKSLVRGDMPDVVHNYVAQEFVRSCLVSYESLPKDVHHEGWGRPDELVHIVIPTHPMATPHARMLHRFRFIIPLLPVDEDGLTPLHYYDAAIQLARNGDSRAIGEQEFDGGLAAAETILNWYFDFASNTPKFSGFMHFCNSLNECRLEMVEGSSTQLSLLSESKG
ncbi:hypothetical protein H0H93_008123 [Arthromyces matolae]|nr:hypothetical protein H0H93_008123 [Arthromyces matolae]